MKEFDFCEIMRQFDALKEAVVDSSAFIYADKAGFLKLLLANIQCSTVKEVVAETGFQFLNKKVKVFSPRNGSQPSMVAPVPVDRKVFQLSQQKGQPLIADDRKLLLLAEQNRSIYFNSLMILLWLLYRGCILEETYACMHQELLKIAHYSPRVVRFGERLHMSILKYGGS